MYWVTACKFEYVLDEKTFSPITTTSHYDFEDGTTYDYKVEFAYDVEMPEEVNAYLAFDRQTEDLRTITLVFNVGTEREKSVEVQVPKGMKSGVSTASGTIDEVEIYAGAAFTEPHVAKDLFSDVTIYIKWLA